MTVHQQLQELATTTGMKYMSVLAIWDFWRDLDLTKTIIRMCNARNISAEKGISIIDNLCHDLDRENYKAITELRMLLAGRR